MAESLFLRSDNAVVGCVKYASACGNKDRESAQEHNARPLLTEIENITCDSIGYGESWLTWIVSKSRGESAGWIE
eukprot:758142-Hanusia_phi.AAC.2